MIRGILTVCALLALLLVGLWVRELRHDNATLNARLEKTERELVRVRAEMQNPVPRPAPNSANPSTAQTTATTSQPTPQPAPQPTAAANTTSSTNDGADLNLRIQAARQEVQRLEDVLNQLHDDSQSVDVNSRAYRAQQAQANQNTRAGLLTQLQSLETNLHASELALEQTRHQKRTPERTQAIQDLEVQIANLKLTRSNINIQIRQLGIQAQSTNAAISNEVGSEKTEVSSERRDATQRLQQARAELQRLLQSKPAKASQTR